VVNNIISSTLKELLHDKTPKEVENIKIADISCGSGSFLLSVYQYLLDWHLYYYTHKATKQVRSKALTPDGNLQTNIKKKILTNNIFGVDCDAQAVEVTKLSLLIKCMEGETPSSISTQLTLFNERALPNLDENIKTGNSLIETDFYDEMLDFGEEKTIKAFNWKRSFPQVFERGGFDIIVGNPPYGAVFSKSEIKYFQKKYKLQNYQAESYLLFIEKSINLLKSKGLLGYIIPNPWLLNLKTEKIRKFIFSKIQIENIVHFQNKVFPEAVVDTEIIVFRNSTPQPSHLVRVELVHKNNESEISRAKQQTWIDADGEPVNIFESKTSITIKNKIAKHPILDSICKITQGTKPFQVGKGHPKQTQKTVTEKPYVSESKIDKYFKPLLRGSLMNRYQINWDNNYWIKFGDWLAEPRYSAGYDTVEKIIIRQTGDYLNATLDSRQFIVRDNLYTIIPNSSEINIKYVLGLLNSSFLNWYYQNVVNPEKGEALAQVKRGHLALLPIKLVDKKNRTELALHDKIDFAVSKLLLINEDLKETKLQTKREKLLEQILFYEDSINQAVFSLYGITNQEILVIQGNKMEILSDSQKRSGRKVRLKTTKDLSF
jgi:predicted RNA methylase